MSDYNLRILILFLHISFTWMRSIPHISKQDFQNLRNFTDGRTNYYRYLKIDEQSYSLYVGAMELVFRLSLSNIEEKFRVFAVSDPLVPTEKGITQCKSYPNRVVEYECKNHIRIIEVEGSNLYVCGTGSFYPQEFMLNKNNLRPVGEYAPEYLSGAYKCPQLPDQSFTYIYARKGNPGNDASIYTGVPYKQYSYISRPKINGYSDQLLTDKAEEWLKDPEFIASFETTPHIYFFFNEYAFEDALTGRKYVPTVARICKNDIGGRDSFLGKRWTSYIKMRLDCSITKDSNSDPFYFEHMKDVQKVDDRFIGVFTTSMSGINGSAICEFNLTEIDKAFNERSFIEKDNAGTFIPVNNKQENVRPGSCNNSSQSLEIGNLIWIKSHPMIYDSLKPRDDKAVYYKPNVIYTKLAVDVIDRDNYIVLFMTTYDGKIHKYVYKEFLKDRKIKLISILEPFGNTPVEIHQFIFHNDMLYLSTDDSIKQFNVVDQCSFYKMCTDCVLDPHCGWNQELRECSNYRSGYHQNTFHSAIDTCEKACYNGIMDEKICISGDPIHLKCDSVCNPEDDIIWYHNDKSPIIPDGIKYLKANKNSLVVFNATHDDMGTYTCKSGQFWLAKYKVSLPVHTNPTDIWREEFRNWCAEFNNYRKEFNSWLCVKNECYYNDECLPNAAPQCMIP